MSAPDLDGLETPLIKIDGGISCLRKVAEGMGPRSEDAALLHWVANNLERDLEDAHKWFDEAHRAHVEAKGAGPVVVT